jgi:glycine hydroxymethyltransferase
VKKVFDLIVAEQDRQHHTIDLIASENYALPAACQVLASSLTNKYAEGYPGKRYYAGCGIVDQIEQMAIDACKQVFGAEHANVQPHSGSQANMAIYAAFLKPGDTILGMQLAAGGHLTHGSAVNFSGQLYNVISYGVDAKTELIDYDELERLAIDHKPRLIVAGSSAYSRAIDFERIRAIADHVGAFFVADIAHLAGLIIAGLHPSPIAFADAVSGTTHKTLRGPRGGFIVCKKEHQERIDRAVFPGIQGGPMMNVIAAKAVTFDYAKTSEFIAYQKQVLANAKVMAEACMRHGYRIVSGGTDTHMFIVDLTDKKMTGLQAQQALEAAGITVSRSCVPFDVQKPWIGSGIRIGVNAVTTRGMRAYECTFIASLMDEVLQEPNNIETLERVKDHIENLGEMFPIPE